MGLGRSSFLLTALALSGDWVEASQLYRQALDMVKILRTSGSNMVMR